jgi:galactoside O-acetyltransferase
MDKHPFLHTEEIYDPNLKELMEEQQHYKNKLFVFNQTAPFEKDKRENLLNEMFREFGENSYIERPLNANWGGKFVHIGKNVYANFNLTLVDDTYIYIGDNVLIGPNVVIISGNHPTSPELRKKGLQYNQSVRIGNNVWIGSGSQILPGIEIGENSVVGAGSVVTKDIPANVMAAGVPCKVIRELEN